MLTGSMRPTTPSRTNTKKTDALLITGDWNAKVGSQETPRVTGNSGPGAQNEAGRKLVLPREHAGHGKQPLPTAQEKILHMDITRCSTPKSDYTLCSQRWRSSIQSAKTRPGTNCGSDNELLITKFRLTLKKIGRTTRPFRSDLNQTPYDYTVEVTNRFKGLDPVDRLPEELWTEVFNTAQEAVAKTTPKKKKCKREKCCLRRPYK